MKRQLTALSASTLLLLANPAYAENRARADQPGQDTQEQTFEIESPVKKSASRLKEKVERATVEALLKGRNVGIELGGETMDFLRQARSQLKELLTGEESLSEEQLAEQARRTDIMLDKVKFELNKMKKKEPKLRENLGEHMIEGEWEAIKSGVDAVVKTVAKRAFAPASKPTGVTKGDHGKSQACLTGKIKFNADIPADLQKGVVKANAEYTVESRISMAEELQRNDRSSIGRGVALKLKNISKTVGQAKRLPDFPNTDEQDFLMTMPDVFFVRNIVDYSKAFALRAKLSIPGLIEALKVPEIRSRLLEEIQAVARKKGLSKQNIPGNMLAESYFSKHPYAWGETESDSLAVKYSVAPCDSSKLRIEAPEGKENYQADFIRAALEQNGEVCFKFRIQRRATGLSQEELNQSYPIEDGHVSWKEDENLKSQFIDVATVTFSKQDNANWDSAEALTACHQKDEFTPWNGLLAHQPMSNLARGRRYVYRASALVRQLNSDAAKIKPADQLPKLQRPQ